MLYPSISELDSESRARIQRTRDMYDVFVWPWLTLTTEMQDSRLVKLIPFLDLVMCLLEAIMFLIIARRWYVGLILREWRSIAMLEWFGKTIPFDC